MNIYFCPTTKVWNLGDLTNKFWVLTVEKTEQGKRMEIVAAMQYFNPFALGENLYSLITATVCTLPLRSIFNQYAPKGRSFGKLIS